MVRKREFSFTQDVGAFTSDFSLSKVTRLERVAIQNRLFGALQNTKDVRFKHPRFIANLELSANFTA